MPRKPRLTRLKREIIPLTEGLIKMLLFQEVERGTPEWEIYIERFFDDSNKLYTAWMTHEKQLMSEWEQSGREGFPWALEYLRHQGKI